jgi:hypothetical protein
VTQTLTLLAWFTNTLPAGYDRRLARLHRASAERKTSGRKEDQWAARNTAARLHKKTPRNASQLAAMQSAPPSIQQAHPAWNKTTLFRVPVLQTPYERKFTTATTSRSEPSQKQFPWCSSGTLSFLHRLCYPKDDKYVIAYVVFAVNNDIPQYFRIYFKTVFIIDEKQWKWMYNLRL